MDADSEPRLCFFLEDDEALSGVANSSSTASGVASSGICECVFEERDRLLRDSMTGGGLDFRFPFKKLKYFWPLQLLEPDCVD